MTHIFAAINRRARPRFFRAGLLIPVLGILVVVMLGMGVVAIPSHQTPVPSLRATKPSLSANMSSSVRQGGQAPRGPVTVAQGTGGPVPLGVYTGPGSPSAARAFANTSGAGTPFAFDYLDDTSWQTISDPVWFMQRWAGSGFQMIWAIPMLPRSGGSMAAGAAGKYNRFFAALAHTLVANGQGSAILVPGWDPSVAGMAWSVSSSAGASQYISFFQQIVTTMRGVRGARFHFAWDASGQGALIPEATYPGNAVVDVIATDAFDRGPGTVADRWAALSQSSFGLDWFASFAAKQHKPLMLAKWGLAPKVASGGGDDPVFVRDLLSWASQEHVVAAVAWDYGSWALAAGNFPLAAAELSRAAAKAS